MLVGKLGPSHDRRTFRHQRTKGKQNTAREFRLSLQCVVASWITCRAKVGVSKGDGSIPLLIHRRL
jgi:hypothetical protein